MQICATLGLVLAILSFCILPVLFGPAAIVLGTIGGTGGYVHGWVAMGLGTVSTFIMCLAMFLAMG